MNNVKNDFIKRKEEIEDYFTFLLILDDEENTYLKYKKENNLEPVEEKIPDQLQKILKANGFLILYNLIEATIRNSLHAVFDTIEDSKISYTEIADNLKNIWIEQKTKNLREGNFRQDTLKQCVLSIADTVLQAETIILDKEQLDFSGNLDAKKIRDIAKQYGFEMPSPNGENLLTIKTKRNHLAHGSFTFADIGKDFSIKDLNGFKEETFTFLDDVITKIEKYLTEEKFKVGIK